ncbi:type I restriction endonuclease subunit R [Psychroflexus montanilacus]|uniref:type I restriction endonuclease subunit R n=1 Tax=Psychroflexus montanilacus TaxID=2873598 RepID=UPI001CCE864B|nr:type I restriction endonuclease subunit R [Psychroflexus montanilacus]MBZ9650719.1 type I restriction endonuclease subunit R [Psychroflexus montanilacus]
MKKFTEAKLEEAIAELLTHQGYTHVLGSSISRSEEEVLIEADIHEFLSKKYKAQNITQQEIEHIIRELKVLPSSDLYESNKTFTRYLSDGFSLKREDRSQKDIWIYLVDFENIENNHFKFVTQLEITGNHKRIPDGIIYVNGFPLAVFEFKTAIEEDTTIHDAYKQLTTRYKRDIPELFKYNSFCVLSDGVNNKSGSFFAAYEYYYAWRRISTSTNDVDGIDSLHSLVQGMLDQRRLIDIVQNFVYIPDSSKRDEKIVCRYPQYYAVRSLFASIKKAQKPLGNGKGGTYFGATGSGKSYTMLYLARLLMKSDFFENPTLVLITDRTDLDEQLSGQFTNAKTFIGDDNIQSVESRAELRELLQNRASGGVFLTTIHKFTEDLELLTERNNVICISDEAHRSQTNLDQKIRVTQYGVKKTYGFAKYLHDSLPNATYVGFTGTPIDATLDVFGEVVDAYTMTESVKDEITVKIVYEGRAARVALENSELAKIEDYYKVAEEEGANEYQVEKSKKQTANMNTILGDPDRLKALAEDFVEHYEKRVNEGSTVKGKAMFVSSSRDIAYHFYLNLLELRPEWGEVMSAEKGATLTEKEKKEIKPMERVKLIMTRNQDDPEEMYNLLGTKEYKKELDRQFKNEKSNFKIAIVVDMWLTGFDVPFLDTIYIDKPIQKHSLIQTISRVNRRFKGKNKGLVVDYIGIKNQMNLALAMFSNADAQNFEDIDQSLIVVKNHLDLLGKLFHKFDSQPYFSGSSLAQLNTLNFAVEFIQQSKDTETRFMALVKRLKAAYDICTGSEKLTQDQRDYTHFYLAVRSIIAKLTKGSAPDTAQMNKKVKEMITNALQSQGIEEIFKMGEDGVSEQNIFDEDYLDKINKIKLPNTKIKILQKLLAKAIGQIKQVNKVKGVDFSKKMETLVTRYNDRDKNDVLISEVYEDMADQLTDLIWSVYEEMNTGNELGIGIEEKAFYDILYELCIKYDFTYPEEKLIELAKSVKKLVDNQAQFPDWSKREDIKSSLKVGLILMLDEHGYPPVERDEVYQEIFEQAENYKKFRG